MNVDICLIYLLNNGHELILSDSSGVIYVNRKNHIINSHYKLVCYSVYYWYITYLFCYLHKLRDLNITRIFLNMLYNMYNFLFFANKNYYNNNN